MEIQLLISALLTSFGLTSLLVYLAPKLNIISRSDFRRDGRKIPLLGGLGIFLTILGVASAVLPWTIAAPLFCVLPLVLVGVLDDIKELAPVFKFSAQIFCTVAFLYVTPEESLFLNSWGFHYVASYVLSFFWIIGLINAVNFIDGVDGQAATYAIVVFLALYLTTNNANHASMLLIATGATVSFLFFNSPPAKIFLGEVGASLLGFMVGIFTATHDPINPNGFNMLGILFLSAFPLTDVILSVARRVQKRQTPFVGDKDHIHHKLRKIGLSSGILLSVSTGVAGFCGVAAFVLSRVEDWVVGVTLGVMFTVSLLSILAFIYYLEFRLGHQISKYSKTLIDKHLRPHSNVNFDPNNFHAVVVDLLPYYKELQQEGFPVVDAFILEFSEIIRRFSLDRGQVQSAGIYSVVILFEGKHWTEIEKKRLEKSLYELTKKFGVVKNATERPEGLYYFSSDNPNKHVRILDNRRIGIKRKAG